jgi:hypothetical protein
MVGTTGAAGAATDSTSPGAGASFVRSRGGGGDTSRFTTGNFADGMLLPFPAPPAPVDRAIVCFFSGTFPLRAMVTHYAHPPPGRHEGSFANDWPTRSRRRRAMQDPDTRCKTA